MARFLVAEGLCVCSAGLFVVGVPFDFAGAFVAWVRDSGFGGVGGREKGEAKQVNFSSNGPKIVCHRHSCHDWRDISQRV